MFESLFKKSADDLRNLTLEESEEIHRSISQLYRDNWVRLMRTQSNPFDVVISEAERLIPLVESGSPLSVEEVRTINDNIGQIKVVIDKFSEKLRRIEELEKELEKNTEKVLATLCLEFYGKRNKVFDFEMEVGFRLRMLRISSREGIVDGLIIVRNRSLFFLKQPGPEVVVSRTSASSPEEYLTLGTRYSIFASTSKGFVKKGDFLVRPPEGVDYMPEERNNLPGVHP